MSLPATWSRCPLCIGACAAVIFIALIATIVNVLTALGAQPVSLQVTILKFDIKFKDANLAEWTQAVAAAVGVIIAIFAGYIAMRTVDTSRLIHLFARVDEHNRTIAGSTAWQSAIAVYAEPWVLSDKENNDLNKYNKKNIKLQKYLRPSDIGEEWKNAFKKLELKDDQKHQDEKNTAWEKRLFPFGEYVATESGQMSNAECASFNEHRMAARLLHLSHINLVHQAWVLSSSLKSRRSGKMDGEFAGWKALAQRVIKELRVYGNIHDIGKLDPQHVKPLWYCLGCRDIALMIFDDESPPSIYGTEFIQWLRQLPPPK